MTINSISQSYLQSLYSSSTAPTAAAGFSIPTSSTKSAPTSTASSASSQVGNNASDSFMQAAMAKLQQTDPALAQKIQAFQTQVQGLQANGASQATIANTVQSDLSSLSGQQQSELSSAMSSVKPHHHHHGGGGEAPASTSSTAAPTSATSPTAAPSTPQTGFAALIKQMYATSQNSSPLTDPQSSDTSLLSFAMAA